VSHDRHLVSSTCDALWRVDAGRCEPFDGDLDDYARWLSQRGNTTGDKSPAKVLDAAAKAQQRALRDTVGKLESQMSKTQARLAEIDSRMGDATLYEAARKKELDKLTDEQRQLRARLDDIEAQWLAGMEQLESL